LTPPVPADIGISTISGKVKKQLVDFDREFAISITDQLRAKQHETYFVKKKKIVF